MLTTFTCRYPLLAPNINKSVDSIRKSIPSFIHGIWYASRWVSAFNVQLSTKMRKVLFFFMKKTIGAVHSVAASSFTVFPSILPIENRSNAQTFGPALYGVECNDEATDKKD